MRARPTSDLNLQLASILARHLGEALKDAGISPAELSRRTGISKAAISNAMSEKNPKIPNLHTLYLIAKTLGRSLDYLVGNTFEFDTDKQSLAVEFYANAFLPDNKIYESVAISDDSLYRVYICDTIPEFIKTEAVLKCELGQRPELSDYVERMKILKDNLLKSHMSGLFLCDMSILHQLLSLTGLYRNLTLEDQRTQIDQLINYTKSVFPKVTGYAVDYRSFDISTAYLYGHDKIVSFQHGGYLLCSSQVLTTQLHARIKSATQAGVLVEKFLQKN
jgi:transcriptional regulator with XRE-family HTH domain